MTRRVGAAVLGAVLCLAACSSDDDTAAPDGTASPTTTTTTPTTAAATTLDPAACQRLAVNAVTPAQTFLDGLAGLTVAELEAMDPPPDFTTVQADIQRRADEAIGLGCDPVEFQQTVDAAVADLAGEGEVAEELAAVLRGEAAPEVAGRQTEPSEVAVTPADDLAAVLARVGPGSTVAFAAGTYELSESLLVDVDVRLIGEGSSETVIESSAEGVAVAFVGPGGLVVEGMTVRHTGERPATVLLAIEGPVTVRDAELSGAVAGDGDQGGGHGLAFAFEDLEGLPTRTDAERAGALVVERVVLADNDGAGLLASGSAAPLVTDSTITGNGACGVCALGRGRVRVEGSRLAGNAVGAQISGESPIAVVDNTIADSSAVGIAIDGAARPELRGNVITGSASSAIQVTGEARPIVAGNTVRGGPVGLLIAETAQGIVRDSTFDGQEVALQSGGESQLTANNNTVQAATLAAFSVGEDSRARLTGNTISEVPGAGIEVTAEATATVRDNEITGAGDVGLSVTGRAVVDGGVNRIEGRDIGIQAGETAQLDLSDDAVSASPVAGVLLAGESVAAVRNAEISSGAGVGILVSETANATIEGGTLSANAAGLIVRDSAAPTVTGITISDNDVGLQLEGAAAPLITLATISTNRNAGVVYAGTAAGELSASTITDNGAIGVQVGETATPTVRGNMVSSAGDYGLLYVDGAAGTAADNTITGAVQFGIHLGGFAYPQVTGNTVESPVVAAIAYTQASGGAASGNRCPAAGVLGIVRVVSSTVEIGANECAVATVEQ